MIFGDGYFGKLSLRWINVFERDNINENLSRVGNGRSHQFVFMLMTFDFKFSGPRDIVVKSFSFNGGLILFPNERGLDLRTFISLSAGLIQLGTSAILCVYVICQCC